MLLPILLVLCAATVSAQTFPLKISSNGRYMVDQNDVPFFFMGDASPQQMFQVLSLAQMTVYYKTRSAQGFNAIWSYILCGDTEVPCTTNLATSDGLRPFTSGSFPNYDLRTPNAAYWARMDDYIKQAATYKMVVLMFVFDTNNNMAMAAKAGNSGMYAFGQWLANRYKNFPNIIWAMGNDFQTWKPGLLKGTNDARVAAQHNELIKNLMQGILSVDSNHIMMTELHYLSSLGSDDPVLQPYNSVRTIYTYYCTYPKVYEAYNSTPTQPAIWIEGGWENTSTFNMTYSEKNLRQQEWYNFLAGGIGGFMWANDTLTNGGCCANYVAQLSTTGASQMQVVKNTLTAIPWHKLVPDQSHVLVTAGYGTQSTVDSGTDLTCLNTTNYVTTAKTSDGRYSVSYAPVATTLAVNMAQYATPVRVSWVDPTNGARRPLNGGTAYTNSGTRSFTTPGSNAAGATDWVLLAVPVPAGTARSRPSSK